jgi:hypothetical protein
MRALLAAALEKNRLMWFDGPASVLTNDGQGTIVPKVP